MFIKILLGLVALIAVFLVFVAFLPGDFRYARSTLINAPAPIIFGHINDLKLWNEWSPWAKLDPNAKSTFEGPASGVDSKMSWAGNMEVGEGSLTIVESVPAKLVKFRLDFVKPMKATHMADFTLEPQDDGATKVTWAMYGNNNYIGKLMGVMMNCKKMMNGYFDQGLASLKQITETQAQQD